MDNHKQNQIKPEDHVENQIFVYNPLVNQCGRLDFNNPLDESVPKLEIHEIDPEKEDFEMLQLKYNFFPQD